MTKTRNAVSKYVKNQKNIHSVCQRQEVQSVSMAKTRNTVNQYDKNQQFCQPARERVEIQSDSMTKTENTVSQYAKDLNLSVTQYNKEQKHGQ